MSNINQEIQILNLRWSNEAPKPGDQVVKGFPIGLSVDLQVDYLLDEEGNLWSIKSHVNWWMEPIGLAMLASSFPYNILGITESISAKIADGSTAEYYKINALCYAVVELHKQKTYSSVLNTEHDYNSKGFVKSIAMIVDEDELRHRWKNPKDAWHHDNRTHPSTPILHIPPPLTQERIQWLKALSKGDAVSIISPFYSVACQDQILLRPQKGIVERVTGRLIRVAYCDRGRLKFWRMGYDEDRKIALAVSAKDGIKISAKSKVYSWIRPACR